MAKITEGYYNAGQPGSFGGSPIAKRYQKGNVKDFLTGKMLIPFTDQLDIGLDVDKYLLNGYTTCGWQISLICSLWRYTTMEE